MHQTPLRKMKEVSAFTPQGSAGSIPVKNRSEPSHVRDPRGRVSPSAFALASIPP
jgi:hypothetical protein